MEWILRDGVPWEVPSKGVLIQKKKIWFYGEVSEQSDQVARKPDFWLRTVNNDPKQKDES